MQITYIEPARRQIIGGLLLSHLIYLVSVYLEIGSPSVAQTTPEPLYVNQPGLELSSSSSI